MPSHFKHNLSSAERIKILLLDAKGESHRQIARAMKCHPSTVTNTIKRWQEEESVEDRPKSGRPKKFSPRATRAMKFSMNKGEFDNAVHAASVSVVPASAQTVRAVLRYIGAHPYHKTSKTLISATAMEKRVEWCMKYKNWTVEQWENVWFSDESYVYQALNNSVEWVWDMPGNGFGPRRTKSSLRGGGLKQMIWAMISSQGMVAWSFMSDHVDAEEYKAVLAKRLKPALAKYWPKGCQDEGSDEGGEADAAPTQLYFMQDNARVHTSKKALDYLDTLEEATAVKVLDWPAYSPDLNPIENYWAIFKRALRQKPMPKDSATLKNYIQETVVQLDQENRELFQNLFRSMPYRIQCCLKNKGAPTQF
eukprot:m.284830 g.284830  ORF g.284830 m.284830 type:complete len:365 (-) comp22914_c0_seq8:348-1442(-)